MAGCVFLINGEACEDFDAQEFVKQTNLQTYDVESKSLRIMASEADGDDFRGQISDAVEFLEKNIVDLQKLSVHGPMLYQLLDFGIWQKEFQQWPAQFFHLPPDFVKLAGSLGIAIELSFYAVSSDDESTEERA